MKVLGISGSPRQGGNTDILVRLGLEVLAREKGEVNHDTEGLDTIRNLAENMAWLLRKTHQA